MKICFPAQKDDGMDSVVFNHFGSAPLFVVVDTETDIITTITNRDQHHQHGACNPIMAIGGSRVDAVIVGGIGGGALSRLQQMGIRVFRAGQGSIRENLAMFLALQLPEFTLQQCCGGHAQDGGCAH